MILGAMDEDGEDSFDGYIGKGLLTVDLIDENQWQTFWEEVKNTKPIDTEIIIGCKEFYHCEDRVDCGTLMELPCDELLECDVGYYNCFSRYLSPVLSHCSSEVEIMPDCGPKSLKTIVR